MVDVVDPSLIDWSRAQFALTAMYHWIFVPLTLGLSFLIAFMETMYVRTNNPEWKKTTQFWMILFGINFAIGVATGIILEFQFGTNWSNYSWFVGDIFGAPLAIEGILAFFMESTFVAVMFFGWNKVSRRAHLVSTWLVAIGASLSALWILVANAWMQNPVGMWFNPETARNEMIDFWAVIFSPLALNKFLHTILSGFVLAAVFVVGISAWYLLKKRSVAFAHRSIRLAAVFGLAASVLLVISGDTSARLLAKYQPMKFAATEALHQGTFGAPLTLFGIPSQDTTSAFTFEIPRLLSWMTYNDGDAYVAGINDLLYGNPAQGILSAAEKIERGKAARAALRMFQRAQKAGDEETLNRIKERFADPAFREQTFRYFGYGFLNDIHSLVPNVPVTFWSFRLMVGIGFFLMALFAGAMWFSLRQKLESNRWFLWGMLLSIPLPYLAGQAGWVVAELGRQPWAIQDYLPTVAAASQIDASSVQVTFWLFAVLFTVLLVAEVSILLRQISKGPAAETEQAPTPDSEKI